LALRDCLDKAEFGAVHIHTDEPSHFRSIIGDAGVELLCTRFSSVAEAMAYLWYDVPRFLRTSHALIVQWDSWIIDSAQWCEGFLGCDYIGAPWGWHGDRFEVGNGGFSLRSRRLMEYLGAHRDRFPIAHPEDDIPCRHYRPALEAEGLNGRPTSWRLVLASSARAGLRPAGTLAITAFLIGRTYCHLRPWSSTPR
jgi:hypothetical protein